MRVLGVDPGSRICGYAVVSVEPNRRCRYIECGVLTSEANLPMEHRARPVVQKPYTTGNIMRSVQDLLGIELDPA